MAQLEVPDEDLKMLRETLCLAQGAIGYAFNRNDYGLSHTLRLQQLIDQIDVLRPLGPDGSHGDLHTDHCGCEDKGDAQCLAVCPDNGIARKIGYIIGSQCTDIRGHGMYRNGVGHLFPKGPSNGV